MGELSLTLGVLLLFFCVALLYSSVGHGGATGYLALFALLGAASAAVVPVALMLNVLVAGTGFVVYWRSGNFRPKLLLPFALTSIPAAFIGGSIRLHSLEFTFVLGSVLMLAGLRLIFLRTAASAPAVPSGRSRWFMSLGIGTVLGLVSGMIGIGGGVFLSPIILLLGWGDPRETAAVSSGFIVLNSLSGLAAHLLRSSIVIESVALLGAVVLVGGVIGATLGARYLRLTLLRSLLGVVLLVAGGKLIATIL